MIANSDGKTGGERHSVSNLNSGGAAEAGAGTGDAAGDSLPIGLAAEAAVGTGNLRPDNGAGATSTGGEGADASVGVDGAGAGAAVTTAAAAVHEAPVDEEGVTTAGAGDDVVVVLRKGPRAGNITGEGVATIDGTGDAAGEGEGDAAAIVVEAADSTVEVDVNGPGPAVVVVEVAAENWKAVRASEGSETCGEMGAITIVFAIG